MRDWFIYRQPDFTMLMLMHRSSGSFNIPSPILSFPPAPPPPEQPTGILPSSVPGGVGNMTLALVGGAFKPEVLRLTSVVHVF